MGLKDMHMFQATIVVVTEGCTVQNDGTVFCRLNGVSCIRLLFVAWMYAFYVCGCVYVLSFASLVTGRSLVQGVPSYV
jgi:hypothetical protein